MAVCLIILWSRDGLLRAQSVKQSCLHTALSECCTRPCAGSNAFVCVGTFSRADKKVSDPPAEYAPLGSAPAAETSSKGKAAAQADDSGKGKTGSLNVAALPRYRPSALQKPSPSKTYHAMEQRKKCAFLWLLLSAAPFSCIQIPAQRCAKSPLCSLSSPIMGQISAGCHTIPPYKLVSNNPRLPVCF